MVQDSPQVVRSEHSPGEGESSQAVEGESSQAVEAGNSRQGVGVAHLDEGKSSDTSPSRLIVNTL